MRKSASAAATYDSGRTSRGKATFVTTCAWLTRLAVPLAIAVERKVQGRTAP